MFLVRPVLGDTVSEIAKQTECVENPYWEFHVGLDVVPGGEGATEG